MGYAVDEEHLYLFTNYVHGGDLHQLLLKEVQFSIKLYQPYHIHNYKHI